MGRQPGVLLFFAGLMIASVPVSSQADAAAGGPLANPAGAAIASAPKYGHPVVRVIHVHAESAAVQVFYGYRPEQPKAATDIADGARGAQRFERLAETSTGPDRGFTQVAEAMNNTVIARIDATGEIAQECVHGAVEDVADHAHAATGPMRQAKEKPADPASTYNSGG